ATEAKSTQGTKIGTRYSSNGCQILRITQKTNPLVGFVFVALRLQPGANGEQSTNWIVKHNKPQRQL
ncbi:MAG: hypothetical protein WBW04_17650, partial [Nitrolancea sp.]